MSVISERRGPALLLTIDRPQAGNSLDPSVGRGLIEGFDLAESDPAIRAVIITGAGDRIFSAGMDLKAFAAGADMTLVGTGLARLAACPLPTVAAVNGMALAGGLELMLTCDLVVAAENARFGLPEVKRGLVAAGGGTRLPQRIPLQIALELGLTGESISSDRASELGLVNRVAPAAEVLDVALDLVDLMAANGPLALAATKRLMYEEIGPGDPDHVREVTRPVFESDDAAEGARAFAEKRPPVWKGS